METLAALTGPLADDFSFFLGPAGMKNLMYWEINIELSVCLHYKVEVVTQIKYYLCIHQYTLDYNDEFVGSFASNLLA